MRGKMPILLFLIDTSASMNQRTDLGTSYLDIAKGAVELFLKVKGGEGRAGESSRGVGVVVDLGASVTSVSPPPPSFPSRPPPSSLVTQLRARDPASRGDRYMLVTYDEPPYCIKVKGPSRAWAGGKWEPGAQGCRPLPPPEAVLRCPAERAGWAGARGGLAERRRRRGPGDAGGAAAGQTASGWGAAEPVAAPTAAASEHGGHFAFV